MGFRHLSASLLIFAFCLPALSTWSLFSLRRQEIRKEIKTRIKQGVPQAERTIVRLSDTEMQSSDFTWVKDHEFRYQGKMYDVLERKVIGDRTEFACILDEDETRLFKTLDEQIQSALNGDPVSKQQNEKSQRFYRNLFYESSVFSWTIQHYKTSILTIQEKAPITLFVFADSPPPEYFL